MSIKIRARVTAALLIFVSLAAYAPASAGGAGSAAGAVLEGTLTFRETPPSGAHLASLRALGLRVQGMKHLPLAIVRGTAAQLGAALAGGAAIAFYPDERIVYASTTSNHAIGVDQLHKLGFTGEGTTVAIVDSGIDATHPDLADHVVHNVTIVDPSAQGKHGTPEAPFYVAVDEGPGSNTDRQGGHGTLVAGVLAADGTTDRSQVGVAPDAQIVGYGTSESHPPILTAFDHILANPDWGIDVVSNSWTQGNWKLYDPGHPVNIATKALTDRGVVVVFAAGNFGGSETEMTLNPFAVAPWTISVAGSTMLGERYGPSSNGLEMDNSEAVTPTNGHVRFTGDRIGLYHPTLGAPAGPLRTSCTQPTIFAVPCVPGGSGTTDGTSFSAPHVAGLAALLRQARPGLSVTQVRQTLEATAAVPSDGSPFWQMGYGVADAAAALQMVQSPNFRSRLRKAHGAAEARVLADRDWRVDASEHWTWVPPVAAVPAAPDRRDLTLPVPAGTDALKVSMNYMEYGARSDYIVTIIDAAGREVGRTASSAKLGVANVLVDLRDATLTFGDWTLRVEGTLGANDDTRDQRVTVVAALLSAQVRVESPRPAFVADSTLSLAFTPDPERATGLQSPEGCAIEPGEPIGTLGPPGARGACHSGQWGHFFSYRGTGNRPAEFTSAPLEQPISVGGELTIVVHNVYPTPSVRLGPSFQYYLDEITADGDAYSIGSSDTSSGLFPSATPPIVDGRNERTFDLVPRTIAAGSSIRLRMSNSGGFGAAQLLFGGPTYGDAGITLTTGHFE